MPGSRPSSRHSSPKRAAGLTSAPAAALLGTTVLIELFGEVIVVLLAHVLLLVALILPILLVLIVFVHAVGFAVHLGV
jgi:hypothetical protein